MTVSPAKAEFDCGPFVLRAPLRLVGRILLPRAAPEDPSDVESPTNPDADLLRRVESEEA